jgi:Uma2 family endonuclease
MPQESSPVMSAISTSSLPPSRPPELYSGDRMSRREFHRIYSQMPEHFKAELVGGVVYVASPLKIRHGTNHIPLGSVLFAYQSATPGTELGDNTTILLGEDGEPQPDLYLRILPQHGGQSRTSEDDYVDGAPELIAEIANSSRSIDLHAKLEDYTRYGVLEYLVFDVQSSRLRWFDLPARQELTIDPDGVLRSRVFPGLWIDTAGLVSKDHAKLMATLAAGLARSEHRDFLQRLAAGPGHA